MKRTLDGNIGLRSSETPQDIAADVPLLTLWATPKTLLY
jgi:hypothetical protein